MANDASKIPVVLKHVTMGVFESLKHVGDPKSRFEQAWKIARSRLVQYGFLRPGSETCEVDKIEVTPKGKLRSQEHRNEGPQKTKLFDHLFERYLSEDIGGEGAPAQNQTPESRALEAELALLQKSRVARRKKPAPASKRPPNTPDKKPKPLGKVVRKTAPKVKRAKRS